MTDKKYFSPYACILLCEFSSELIQRYCNDCGLCDLCEENYHNKISFVQMSLVKLILQADKGLKTLLVINF